MRKGSVPVPAFTKPILLVGGENMNRAIQGDVVVVELFDEKEWKAPADDVVDQDSMSSTNQIKLENLSLILSSQPRSKMTMRLTLTRKAKTPRRSHKNQKLCAPKLLQDALTNDSPPDGLSVSNGTGGRESTIDLIVVRLFQLII